MTPEDIAVAIRIFVGKGWDNAHAYTYSRVSPDGTSAMTSCTFYVQTSISDTRELEFGSKSFYGPGAADFLQWANEAPTAKQFRLGKLLETIREAQLLGEELAVPADFINPLVLMAEQLSTNALEGPKN